MIDGATTLLTRSVLDSRPEPRGLEPFVAAYTDRYRFYGSGKAALRDGLATVAEPGENVLVPAYLPDAVVEPIRELGLEPRFYAMTDGLAPDRTDLDGRIDDDTAAVTSVNYFGFPQPGIDELAAIADDRGCYHVDDNAHAACSVDEGTLLGTRGDLGLTSLHKLFPVPNGALLYLTNPAVEDAFEPSPFAGTNDRIGVDDYRYLLKSVATDVLETHPAVDALVSRGDGEPTTPPDGRYEASKVRMSKLAVQILETVDPAAVRRTRRGQYRAWQRALERRGDVRPLFAELPDGICPQVCPVYADDPRTFLAALERAGIDDAYTWPRLPADVLEDAAYATARRLSRHVVALPVGQGIERETIEAVARER